MSDTKTPSAPPPSEPRLVLDNARVPPKKARRRRVVLVGGLAAVLLLAVGGLVAMSLWVAREGAPYVFTLDGAPPAPVALVLGASVYGRRLSTPLADRMEAAVELYRTGRVKKLILSGDHGQRDYDEVGAMRRYALRAGVPPEVLFLDHAGFTTYESCYRARHVFGVGRAIVVTSAFHLPRSLFIARALGLDAIGVEPKEREYPSETKNRFREFFARIKAFLWVYVVRPVPEFLGAPVDLNGDGRVTHDTRALSAGKPRSTRSP